MLGLSLSSKLDWGFYMVSVVKTTSKKIEASIRSVKFLPSKVAFYFYLLYGFAWNTAVLRGGGPSCYFDILDKLQQRLCRTVGPSFAASLEPLTHRRNVASLSHFYRYYSGRCSSELAQLVLLFNLVGVSLIVLIVCMFFFIAIPGCDRDIYVNSFSLYVARVWNYLLAECFHMTYII